MSKAEVRSRLESLIKDFTHETLIKQVARHHFQVHYSGQVYDDRFRLTRYTYTAENYRLWLLFSELSIIEGAYKEVEDKVVIKFKVVANEFYWKLLKILVGFALIFSVIVYLQDMPALIFSLAWGIWLMVLTALAYMFAFYVISRWRFNALFEDK